MIKQYKHNQEALDKIKIIKTESPVPEVSREERKVDQLRKQLKKAVSRIDQLETALNLVRKNQGSL